MRGATALERLRISWIDAGLLLLLTLVLLPGAGIVLLDLIPLPDQLDFATYYLAAQALNTGQSPYDRAAMDALAGQNHGIAYAAYFYPPAFAALLRPLASIPFPLANALWLGLNLLWYALGIALLARLLDVPARWRLVLFAASLLTPALHHTLELGQINTLLLALLVGMLLALDRGRAGLAGALLGVAGALKIFPLALALPLLSHRRWRAIGGLLLALVGMALLGIVAGGGPEVSITWVTVVLPAIVGGFASPNNQSLMAAAARLGAPVTVEPLPVFGMPAQLTVTPLIAAPALARALGLAAIALIAGVTLFALARNWRQNTRRVSLTLELALLLSLALLATPIVWYHYYLLLLIPIGVGLRAGWARPPARRLIIIGGLLIAIQRYWRITALLGSPLLLSFGTLGALLIWAALAWLVLRYGSPDAPLTLRM